jgi:diguanylate cyclase (GGDEF)-like protein
MEEKLLSDQLLQCAPGGVAKLAFDEMLSILYATDTFYSIVRNVTDKAGAKAPTALLRMVYSADIIYVTQQLAAQKHRKDNMFSFNFRALQQDGSFKWVMVSGNRMEETYQSGTKTVPVYSCLAMDITSLMTSYKKLEQTNDYHRTISELSRDLFFEYEIATDTLSFTELFREIIGKDSVIPGFRKRLEKTKTIHPEELPAIISIYNSMMSGRKQARFELRLIGKDGNPCWYTCYASIIFDGNRNPYKVVGKLSVRNTVSKEPEKEVLKPVFDSLTNVCTKDSAEALITEAMARQEEDSLSALLLIEIRNYKVLNEVRRFINGENLLSELGEILRSRFRTSDIVGRLGLNEFIAYAKDLQSDKAVYDIADRICKAVETIHPYEHTKSGLSVSIGIALQKGTSEYQVILANANTALVMAKKIPASSFEIFSGAIS